MQSYELVNRAIRMLEGYKIEAGEDAHAGPLAALAFLKDHKKEAYDEDEYAATMGAG